MGRRIQVDLFNKYIYIFFLCWGGHNSESLTEEANVGVMFTILRIVSQWFDFQFRKIRFWPETHPQSPFNGKIVTWDEGGLFGAQIAIITVLDNPV